MKVIVWALLGCASAFAPPGGSLRPLGHHVSLVCARRPAVVAPLGASPSPEESQTELAVYGAGGVVTSLIVAWSEWTLKSTGCGLPAGPFGLLGAIEGVSYLAIVGIVGASLATKLKTGSGLPAGPAGLLGAAEGLAYLVAAAGLVVLGFQIADYGYIPNAVPVQGGVCS